MTDLTPIARPYGQATYEYAKANDSIVNWGMMLHNLSECITNEEVVLLLENPAYSQTDISVLILSVLQDVLDEYGKNFFQFVAAHNRLIVIPTIYKQFLLHKAEDEKAKKAIIITAFEISDVEIQKLKQRLEQKYQCTIEAQVEVDRGLIGGAKIHIGDHIIDGSIKCMLKKLQHELQA